MYIENGKQNGFCVRLVAFGLLTTVLGSLKNKKIERRILMNKRVIT